ncbi:retron system putative HNH endonuclease [Empedobacter brevis]
MIKITKDLNNVPRSLNHNSGTIGNNTHTKRQELINSTFYIDTDPYNNRYKHPDTKEELKVIYNRKCAFCENKVEQFHVEHYRPKTIYYWLAFSWDNLLLACPTCNQFKGNNFQIQRSIATYDIDFLDNYNNYSSHYDSSEQPLLINPEVTDPSVFFNFTIDGNIISNDPRGIYTIQTCKLDRDDLIDARKKIMDDFENDIILAFATFSNIDEIKVAILQTMNSFKQRLQNSEENFIAFRKKCIEMNYLEDIIKKCLPS